MTKIECLVNQYSEITTMAGCMISYGERVIFKNDNDTVIKRADGLSGIESNIMELAAYKVADKQDKEFLCPIVAASIEHGKILLEMPFCISPVSREQLEQSELFRYLTIDESIDEKECFVYDGHNVKVTDISMNKHGQFDNLGIAKGGNVVIIDYGECEVVDDADWLGEATDWDLAMNLF